MVCKMESVFMAILIIGIVLIVMPNLMCMYKSEKFTTNNVLPLPNDTERVVNQKVVQMGKPGDYESLIYDNATGTIMTGTDFMTKTGVVAGSWIAPAWDPMATGPSSHSKDGVIDPSEYENDPRMIYNKCGLSCCSEQFPTPFQGTPDPLVFDKNGKKKYLSSQYVCDNGAGGSGCLCMTQKQVDEM